MTQPQQVFSEKEIEERLAEVLYEDRMADAKHLPWNKIGEPFKELDRARAKQMLAFVALASAQSSNDRAVASVAEMGLSDGSIDYYVHIRVGDRSLTPQKFKERSKAEYEVATWQWLLEGAEKPRIAKWLDRFEADEKATEKQAPPLSTYDAGWNAAIEAARQKLPALYASLGAGSDAATASSERSLGKVIIDNVDDALSELTKDNPNA